MLSQEVEPFDIVTANIIVIINILKIIIKVVLNTLSDLEIVLVLIFKEDVFVNFNFIYRIKIKTKPTSTMKTKANILPKIM